MKTYKKNRTFASGMGVAVANRTISRVKPDGSRETWEDVAKRVCFGSASLRAEDSFKEYDVLLKHMSAGTILLSGRHLQHGDGSQKDRPGEVFTNCATSSSSFMSFLLLLNGSGVGRCYDDDMMLVDWCQNLPNLFLYCDSSHADVISGEIEESSAEAFHSLVQDPLSTIYYKVADSREGWAGCVERLEMLTYERDFREKTLVLDFSDIRPRSAPIHGMQDRPASGPGPLIEALRKVASLRGQDLPPWQSTLAVDHFLAECVLVGGARRAARIAVKSWRDKDILNFISIKAPPELLSAKTEEEVRALRDLGVSFGDYWSANNSVTVDKSFWRWVHNYSLGDRYVKGSIKQKAVDVFDALCFSSYYTSPGDPGIVNQDQLVEKGVREESMHCDINPSRYPVSANTFPYLEHLTACYAIREYHQIPNPCGEVSLSLLGGYCIIGDVVPYFAESLDDAEDAFRTITRALIRTNLMNFVYQREVDRTNRIGVSLTGIHEWAWSQFGFTWKELVKEKVSISLWRTLSRFKRAVQSEAKLYSAILGLNEPHTDTCIKPAGTTSKLFGLTEGAHLPGLREYLRWVQFTDTDPLVSVYQERGYPTKQVSTYPGVTLIGFPTRLELCEIMPSELIVTASEATPEDQYEFLRLLEKYWIVGVEEDGVTALEDTGNQISYTLKYDPKKIDFESFKQTLLKGQSVVRCCSVLPQAESSHYEYLPEDPIDSETYHRICQGIADKVHEEVGEEHVGCKNGACPVAFDTSTSIIHEEK